MNKHRNSMNLLKSVLLTLLTAVSVLAQPTIVTYRISTLPNSTSVAMISYSDGHVELTNTLPTGLTFSRKGGRLLRTYSPSGKRQWNISQFGQNQFYSPTFKLAIDFNPGGLTVAQRKALGINLFNFWALSDADKAALSFGDGMLYLTESGLHQELEGAGYYECTLAEYEAKIWATMPSCGYGADPGVKLLVFNIEQSNGWSQGNYGANSHWPSWDSRKTKWITLESQTGGMTLEQLAANPTLMAQEEAVRRANRRIIMHKVAKAKGRPGLMTSDGSAMYQGIPRMDFVNSTGIFLDGYADVSHIGGNNGTITLNGRTYTGVTGSHWAQEDVMDAYYYLFDKDMPTSDYQAIFVNKVDSTQNYPYLWSKLNTRHIVADEKGHIQLNRKRMIERQGQTRPILRQIEPQFEGDNIALYNSNGTWSGNFVSSRMTWNDLQPNVTGDGEAPKMWQPPYYNYSRYIVTRFFAGNEPGWGFYVFPPANPNWVNKSLAETPVFNHHLNSLESLLQARADLQPYEQWFTGSTLVEDPEVQLNGTGSFAAYSGTEAYNYNAGVQGTQKPAYMLRFKAQTNGDIRVVVVGGMNQSWTTERTDIIRAPSSFTALKGNLFKVKLRGPAAQVCEFIVKSTDTGQTYEALFIANTAYEKAGFAGRVGVPTSSTSTGTVSTTTVTIPAFNLTVPYSAAAKSDFLSASGDGSHHYNQFITNADWADYTITGAPVTAGDYTLTFNYNTNYTCSGCGTGQYLINGGSAVNFPMDGAAGGVRTVGFTGISLNAGTNTIRFRGTTSASTYFQNYVTVARASSTTTISTTVTSGTTCAFSVSAGSNVAVSCGGSVTLAASASGTGATGLSYTWSRPSYSASGQSVTLTAPSTNGTFDYMVTASKSGCAAQSATKLVTVSGCANSPVVTNKPAFDTFDYQPITSNADWPGFDSRNAPAGEAGLNGPVGEFAELDNGTVRVRVLKRYGAAPGFISQSGGENFINIHDLGTVNGMTLYRGGLTSPNPSAVINSQWAPNPTQPFPANGTGNDPIQMGSTFGNSSPVVAIGRTPTMIYTKTLFKNWPVQDETTDISMEQWVTLVSTRGIRVYYKITCNRLDDQAFYDARQQEFPTFYVRYAYATGAYIGEGGSVQYVSSPSNSEFYMSKPFVAMMPATQSSSDVGIGLYGWGNYKSAHSSANSQEGGNDLTNGRGQSAMNVPMHFDWNGVYYGYHDFIVGTIGQMQDYVNAQGPDPRNTFAWKFNAQNGRGRFVYGQGKDTGFPTPDTGVKISRLPNSTGFVDFHWPKVAIPASSVSKIYMRYKASANWPSTGMAIAGRLSQVNPSDYANQKVNFSLVCNNTWQTVEIPVSSISGWSGTISNLQFTFLDVPTSADLTVQWVNTTNTEP